RVVFLHRVVEEPAGSPELVFDIRQLGPPLLEGLGCLQGRVGFRKRKQLPPRPGENIFGGELLLRRRGNHGRIAPRTHGFEGPALVRGVTFHRFDQIGNEVMALLELHIDVGKGLIGSLPHGNKAVVDTDRPKHDDDDDAKDDPAGGGHETAPEWRKTDRLTGTSLSHVSPLSPTATGGIEMCRRCATARGDFPASTIKKDPEPKPGVSSPDGYSGGKGGAAQRYTTN